MIRIRFDGRSVDRFLSARLTGLPWCWRRVYRRFSRYFGGVTSDDPPAPTRRARRAQTGAVPVSGSEDAPDGGILTIQTGETDTVYPPSSTAPVDVTAVAPTIATVPVADVPTVATWNPAELAEPSDFTLPAITTAPAATEVAGGRTAL